MPDERGQPTLYLDTNVLLDAVDERRSASPALLSRIEDLRWRALTCPFGFLEILEAKKADRWAEILLSSSLSFWQVLKRMGERRTGKSALRKGDLKSVYDNLHRRLGEIAKAVVFPEMPGPVLDRAEEICASTNIEATDSLHLATALHFGCDILVTNDGEFLKLAKPYILATTPEGIENALTEYQRQLSAS